MRALVCDHGLRYEPNFADPAAPLGEALVRVRLAGICNTDLELVRGYMSFKGVLGHEFVGEVVQSENAGLVGRGSWGISMRPAIAAGPASPAVTRTALTERPSASQAEMGLRGLSDFALVNLLPVPGAVRDESAVFVEPLAAACEILEQVAIRPTDRVLILGDGKLGLLVAAVLRLTGVDLAVVGRHAAKLSVARSWGVPVYQVKRGRQSAMATSLENPGLASGQADIVVECTGSPTGFADACRLVRQRHTRAQEHLSWRPWRGYEQACCR